MAKTQQNKVKQPSSKGMKKKGVFMKFGKDTQDELEKLKKETGRRATGIVEDLVKGGVKFNPALEKWISDEAKQRDISRQAAIEVLLFEASELKRRHAQRPSDT